MLSFGAAASAGSEIVLHVYYVGSESVVQELDANTKQQLESGKAFHAGIEVVGAEYSFGSCPRGTGVYKCPPKSNKLHRYKESISLGETSKTDREILDVLREMRPAWQGNGYDVAERNSTHFCTKFAEALEVGPLPEWVAEWESLQIPAEGDG